MRADRLLSLVLLLQARGRVTAGELAAELGVSVRTVYRDLDGLSAAGVPVYREPGRSGGCRLVAGYQFALRGLRPAEAEALLILGVPAALRELGLDRAVEAAHRQIRVTSGLAGPAAPDAAGTSAALVHLDMPRWFRSQEEVPQLRTLAEAVKKGRMLRLRYEPGPAAGARTVAASTVAASTVAVRTVAARTIAPLGLVNKAGLWYLVAMTGSRQIRVFRAARIAAATVLADPAPRPEGFDLAAFWDRWSREFAATRPRLAVRLRASPLALEIFPEVFGDAVIDALRAAGAPDEHGWREVTLSFEHEHAAAHRLAGFGADIEVLASETVRAALIDAARGILARYVAMSG